MSIAVENLPQPLKKKCYRYRSAAAMTFSKICRHRPHGHL
jgi:hypothetical protein